MKLIRKVSSYKTPLNFVSSTVFMYFITLITSFITYRFVAPDYLGIWATFSTFSTIATFLRLGIPNGMNRELPFYLGKGESKKAESFASTTLFHTIISILILFAMAVVFFIYFDFNKFGKFSSAYKYSSVIFFIILCVEPYANYLSGTFRTNDSFNKLSNIQYTIGVFRLLSIVLVYFYSYKGYLCREVLATIINCLLLHYYRPMKKIKPSFKLVIFKDLFFIGFSAFLVSYLTSFVDTLPRLFIIKEASPTELGLFSPVLMVLSIVALIPNTLSSYLYPKFAYAYGQGCDKAYLWKKTRDLLLGSLVLGLFSALIVYLVIDHIIFIFPKYIGAAPYIKLTCLGMAFIGFRVSGTVSVILKLYKWMWVTPICNLVFQTVTIYCIGIYSDDVLYVAAMSLSVTYFLMFIVCFVVTYIITH